MLNENRFLGTFRGHNTRTNVEIGREETGDECVAITTI